MIMGICCFCAVYEVSGSSFATKVGQRFVNVASAFHARMNFKCWIYSSNWMSFTIAQKKLFGWPPFASVGDQRQMYMLEEQTAR
jgi:hypothetical protein